jgi:cytoplasmic iron level regulating protein YaaA (DUF328/UPF0246 family)
MKILLSPAKSIDMSVEIPGAQFSTPIFSKEATSLANKLAKMNTREIMALMSVNENIASLNMERYQNFKLSEKSSEFVKPAAFIFSGEVYRGLEIASLDMEKLERAQNSIRILSGLYGLLKPLDLIYPYRLEMGTSWEITPKIKNLYQFWNTKIARALQAELNENEVVVNLASSEYFKVIPKNEIKNPIITPVFKEYKAGKFSTVMMYAKHARGAMARYIVESNIDNIEELKNYNVDGYRFHEALSNEREWVYTR